MSAEKSLATKSAANMASMTMAAASLLPTSMAKNPAATRAKRGGLIVVAKAASSKAENVSMEFKNKDESSSNGRRELVFAAAAAAACSIAKVAMAESEEPKRGTPDAKKKYAPVCVTMPTARICRK